MSKTGEIKTFENRGTLFELEEQMSYRELL
jgi:hypothetical protein